MFEKYRTLSIPKQEAHRVAERQLRTMATGNVCRFRPALLTLCDCKRGPI
jgi:hypothetical protein